MHLCRFIKQFIVSSVSLSGYARLIMFRLNYIAVLYGFTCVILNLNILQLFLLVGFCISFSIKELFSSLFMYSKTYSRKCILKNK